MPKPTAVLISDIHYNIHTLKLADAAMRQAIVKANTLNIPLIVAGDLHDTKANLRGECISAMLATFKLAKVKPYVIVGNHDLINEKSTEHSLEFLNGLVNLVTGNDDCILPGSKIRLKGYISNSENAQKYLKGLATGTTVICHQGLNKSNAGEYIQDKSAIEYADVAHLRVISGHYHTRQSINTAADAGTSGQSAGSWDYIGNPYTLTFAEANDPEKGFQILMDNGSLEFVPTSLRKHVVLELAAADLNANNIKHFAPKNEDLIWIKLKGTKEELNRITRKDIETTFDISSFKLDLFPLDTIAEKLLVQKLTLEQLLDSTVGSVSNVTDDQKTRLKALWRGLNEKT